MRRLLKLIVSGLLAAAPFQLLGAALSFGPDAETTGDSLDAIVAVVDDDVITRQELDHALVLVERQLRQKQGPPPPPDQLERQVLERLILLKLQQRAAERNGITVDDNSLNATIEKLARQNNLTLDQLRQTIERDGVAFAEFRENIRNELLANRLRQRMVDSRINISEQEVESMTAGVAAAPAGQEQEYHIAHILVAVPEGASPEQLEAARQKAEQLLERLRQGEDFRRLAASASAGPQALEGGDLGWRKAEQLPSMFAEVVLRLQPGQISEPIRSPSGFHLVRLLEVRGRPGQAPPKAITQSRVRHILIRAREGTSDEETRQRLQRLYERLQNDEDFAELARAHSEDTASAVRGGELGWVDSGALGPQLEEQLDRLQPGQVSEPFQTQAGWHIVQVLERRQQPGGSVEAQRAEAREALFRRRVEEEWEQWLRRLRDEAYVEIRLGQQQSAVQ